MSFVPAVEIAGFEADCINDLVAGVNAAFPFECDETDASFSAEDEAPLGGREVRPEAHPEDPGDVAA